MQTVAEVDRKAYKLARQYLFTFKEAGVASDVINHYIDPSERPNTLAGIFERMLESAQNANMRAGVVGGSINGIKNLKKVLYGFQPVRVANAYKDWSDLLSRIISELHPKGKIRTTKRSIWPLFCRTIIGGARFLSRFKTAAGFYSWADIANGDDLLRPAIAFIIAEEIPGIGFPLACDFLKEIGYLDFGKPDVQIKTIFKGLGLCANTANDYQVFKAIIRVASNNKVKPYAVDKVFWLIGSGTFYDHRHLGRNGNINTNRDEFIRHTKKQLMGA